MNFRKSAKGGGVIFNQKIDVADFGNFKQGFLSMKLVLTATIWPMPPCINASYPFIHYKKMQHDFPKMRGWGVKGRLEFFQKFIWFGSGILPKVFEWEAWEQCWAVLSSPRVRLSCALMLVLDLRSGMSFSIVWGKKRESFSLFKNVCSCNLF